MKHIEHTPNEFTDSYNVDCKCPECVDIDWNKQCINCNLLQRDCYGQEHGKGEDILNDSGKQIQEHLHKNCCGF